MPHVVAREDLLLADRHRLRDARLRHDAAPQPSALDGIALIHQAGGVAVLAHPGLNRTDDDIPELAAAGLDGIECFHSKHSASMTRHYLELASRLSLLVTGGSDCHGLSKGKPLIGSVLLPYPYVEKLKVKARKSAASPESQPATRDPQSVHGTV